MCGRGRVQKQIWTKVSLLKNRSKKVRNLLLNLHFRTPNARLSSSLLQTEILLVPVNHQNHQLPNDRLASLRRIDNNKLANKSRCQIVAPREAQADSIVEYFSKYPRPNYVKQNLFYQSFLNQFNAQSELLGMNRYL